jgi:RNA polymerase sigma-70 factor, ECF subfamily
MGCFGHFSGHIDGVVVGWKNMPSPHDGPRADSTATSSLLDRAADGEASAVGELLSRHRSSLREFVDRHLYAAVRGRIDASDVVQDAQAELARRLSDFLKHRPMPFHLWARKITYDRLVELHRRHYHRPSRSVRREQSLPDRSSLLAAQPLLAQCPSPSQDAEYRELAEQVSRALAGLADADREMLLLRHGDGLPFSEIGSLLGIDPAAARKRFGRALLRLRKLLAAAGLLRGAP